MIQQGAALKNFAKPPMYSADRWVRPVNSQLSQKVLDASSQRLPDRKKKGARSQNAVPFDFRQLDRIPKSQLHAIQVLHDNFVRTLGSSLSAYLRSYLSVSLVSVEQLSYAEFLEGLTAPTCLVCLGLRPYDGNAVLELNPNLTFQILEIILGGKGKASGSPKREITEIEQHLLDGFLRILLHDLREAWEAVTPIDFTVESFETEPQFLQVLDQAEAIVAVRVELRIGETTGMINLAFPSLTMKMMRNKFDNQWSLRRSRSNEAEQARMLRLVKPAAMQLDARLEGSTVLVKDLMNLEEGDVLPLDHPVEQPLDFQVNGKLKFRGRVVSTGSRRAFLIDESSQPPGP